MLFSGNRVHRRFDDRAAVAALRDGDDPAFLDLLDSAERSLADDHIEKTVEFQHPVLGPNHHRNSGIREHGLLELEDRIGRPEAPPSPLPPDDDATVPQTAGDFEDPADLSGTPADEPATGPAAERGVRCKRKIGSGAIWQGHVSRIWGCGAWS